MYDYVVKELPQAIQSLPGLDVSKVYSLIKYTDIVAVHKSPKGITIASLKIFKGTEAQCQANCTCSMSTTLIIFVCRLQFVGTAWAVMEL